MFTDTKNLANANSSSALELYFAKSNDKSKGKLRKVWKPLLRLITLKSTTTKSGNGFAATKHPNNVNLNNNSTTSSPHTKDIYELSATQLQQYAAVMRSKVATSEAEEEIASLTDYDNSYQTEATVHLSAEKTQPPCSSAVISSASIEKTPTPTCTGCAHGRNCRHEQFHSTHRLSVSVDHSSNNFSIYTQGQEQIELPVHYISTDDGTFCWTSAQNKIDDDLLNAWLCQSFRQFPLEALVC